MRERSGCLVAIVIAILAAGCGDYVDKAELAKATERIAKLETSLAELEAARDRTPHLPESITAKRFVLVGDEGQKLAELGPYLGGAAFTLFGDDGKRVAYLAASPRPELVFLRPVVREAPSLVPGLPGRKDYDCVRLDRSGLCISGSSDESSRVELLRHADGSPELSLRGSGSVPAIVSLTTIGSGPTSTAEKDSIIGGAVLRMNATGRESGVTLSAWRNGETSVHLSGAKKSSLSMQPGQVGVQDEEGRTRAVVGSVVITDSRTGAETKSPAAFALFDGDGKVLWMEPR